MSRRTASVSRSIGRWIARRSLSARTALGSTRCPTFQSDRPASVSWGRDWREWASMRVATSRRRGRGPDRPPPRGCASRSAVRGLSRQGRPAACPPRRMAAKAPWWRMSCPCTSRTRRRTRLGEKFKVRLPGAVGSRTGPAADSVGCVFKVCFGCDGEARTPSKVRQAKASTGLVSPASARSTGGCL
jgi:hypothetical protein